MHLLIATGIFPPDIGGPAMYSKKIAEEFGKRGWKITVLTYADEIPPLTPPWSADGAMPYQGGEIVGISRNHNVLARYFLYTWNLYRLAKRADLIYAQGPVSEGLPAYLASKITGKKYVLKIVGDPAWERFLSRKQQNNKTIKQKIGKLEIKKLGNWEIGKFIDFEEFQRMKGLPFKTRILRWIERLVAKNASKIITPSEYLKKIVIMWGVDFEKIQVIYNSVDDKKEEISVNKEEMRNCLPAEAGSAQAGKLEIWEDDDIILSAGRLVRWKGFKVLIDIMPKLLEINPNFKLVIAGDGPEYENLKFKILNFKFQKVGDEKIILTGKLGHNKLMQLMQKANVFILNSGYEGLSHVILEAMQSGLPCAISNKGGNSELVENEKTGLLFDYNNREQIFNAIVRLWQDKDLRERIAIGGHEKVKEFGVERMVKETMGTLEIDNY